MTSKVGDVLVGTAEADLESGLARAIDAAPRFAELLTDQWRLQREEFIERVRADREDLARVFDDIPGAVTTLETGLSDRHSGGRTVFRVTFESGTTLVYKPRDGKTDAAFYALLDWLRPSVDVPRPLTSLTRTTHGWFEFVEAKPVESTAEAQRYWQRLGALLCVVDAIGGRDCHRDNLVAAGDTPMLVDAEALFHQYVSQDDAGSEYDPLAVLATGLTPYWKRRQSKRVDTSGAGSPPARHIDDVIHGFEGAYRGILERREALLAPEGPIDAFRPLEIRSLHRYTAVYLETLRDAVAEGELNRDYLERKLNTDDARLQPVVDAEIDALLRLDVPRFTTTGGGTALDLDGHGTIEDWFAESGLGRAIRRIENMNPDDLGRRSDALRSVYAVASLEASFR